MANMSWLITMKQLNLIQFQTYLNLKCFSLNILKRINSEGAPVFLFRRTDLIVFSLSQNAIHQDDDAIIPQPVILQLSSEKLDRHGAYVLDTFDVLFLYVGRAVSDHFCASVLDVPNFSAIPEDMVRHPCCVVAEYLLLLNNIKIMVQLNKS